MCTWLGRLTIKVGVEAVLQVGSGAKVNELQFQGLQVDEKVLILDVSVDDAFPVAGDDGFDHLAEKVSGKLFFQHALLRDEVKEILARLRPLHHNDEGVVALKAINELDHPRQSRYDVHKADFQGNALSANLEKNKEIIVIVSLKHKNRLASENQLVSIVKLQC